MGFFSIFNCILIYSLRIPYYILWSHIPLLPLLQPLPGCLHHIPPNFRSFKLFLIQPAIIINHHNPWTQRCLISSGFHIEGLRQAEPLKDVRGIENQFHEETWPVENDLISTSFPSAIFLWVFIVLRNPVVFSWRSCRLRSCRLKSRTHIPIGSLTYMSVRPPGGVIIVILCDVSLSCVLPLHFLTSELTLYKHSKISILRQCLFFPILLYAWSAPHLQLTLEVSGRNGWDSCVLPEVNPSRSLQVLLLSLLSPVNLGSRLLVPSMSVLGVLFADLGCSKVGQDWGFKQALIVTT